MKDSTKVLIFLFVLGSIILAFLYTGLITFHWPPINSATRTAIYSASNTSGNFSPTPSETPSPKITSTSTLSATPTVVPKFTSTPYIVKYPGFLHCRKAPSLTSEEAVLIRGHYLTILGINQEGDWLYVSVEGKKCWIPLDVPYLELTPSQLPTKIITLTLEFPPTAP